MKSFIRIFILTLAAIGCAWVIASSSAAADPPVIVEPVRVDVVQVHSEGADYVLSMPDSKLKLRFPQMDLIHRTAAETGATNTRYFYFDQPAPKLTLLGTFESPDDYPGVKRWYKRQSDAVASLKLPKPRHAKFSRVNGWDVVQYEQSLRGVPVARLSAHFVKADTWLSVELYADVQSKDLLIGVLKSMSVSEVAD